MVNIRKRGKVYQYQFEIAKVDGKRKYKLSYITPFLLNQSLLKIAQKCKTKEGVRNYQKVIKSSFRDATNYFGFLKYNPAVELQLPKSFSFEVFALTWEDIDLENRTIRVNKTVYSKLKDENGRYATQILRKGVEIRNVADILGHSRIKTTENYYISSSEKTRKEANDILEKIIQSDVINEIINY